MKAQDLLNVVHDQTEKQKLDLNPHQDISGTSVIVETIKDNLKKKKQQFLNDAQMAIFASLKNIPVIAAINVDLAKDELVIDEINQAITGNIIVRAKFNDTLGTRKKAEITVKLEDGKLIFPPNSELRKAVDEAVEEKEIDESLSSDIVSAVADDASKYYEESLRKNYPEPVFAKTSGLVEDSKEEFMSINVATAPKMFTVNKVHLPSSLKEGDIVNLSGLQYRHGGYSEDGALVKLVLVESSLK